MEITNHIQKVNQLITEAEQLDLDTTGLKTHITIAKKTKWQNECEHKNKSRFTRPTYYGTHTQVTCDDCNLLLDVEINK